MATFTTNGPQWNQANTIRYRNSEGERQCRLQSLQKLHVLLCLLASRLNSLLYNLFSTHSSVLSPSFISALLCQCGAVLATMATMVTGAGITQCGGWRGTAENNTSGHQMSPSHAPRSRTPVHTNIFIQIHKYFYGPQREFVRLSGAGHSAREEF